jgi:kynureninase
VTTRADCVDLDARDPLASLRDLFLLPAGVIYLDGNSLGALPRSAPARLREVVCDEWGRGLIRSWNTSGWIGLAQRVGDKIARLVGAGTGELVVTDGTSVNVFKALSAAFSLVRTGGQDSHDRNVIVSERHNFPTDRYIAQSFARERELELRLVAAHEIIGALDATSAILLLTHVDYRSGRMHCMGELDRAAHAAGAMTVWDLSHSAGAVPVDLTRDAADFAVGCGYKYLNGGPGAPAFVWAHPRLAARIAAGDIAQPLSGWLSHAAPFEFAETYRPAHGIARFLCGTPPVLSLAALECGVDTLLAAEAFGGMQALRAKSQALTALFIERVEARCAERGLTLASPRNAELRGSQVSFALAAGGYAIMQALIERGVIGDFRAPDLIRFGFAPLYTRFVDAFDAAEHLAAVLASGEWRAERFALRAAVT